MAKIIYTTGRLIVTGSDTFTVHNAVSGTRELLFSASYGDPTYNLVTYDTGSGKLYITSSADVFSISNNPGGPANSVQIHNNGVISGSSNFTFVDAESTLNLTGSFVVTGDMSAKGPNRSVQFNDNGNLSGSSVLTFDKTTDTLEMTGSTILLASEASALSMEMNESASFEFLTGAANSGSFIVQTSPDTGRGGLESYFGQGIATAAGQPISNQIFGLKYTSGSSASEGELSMTFGKRDLSNLGGANQNNFYVTYEPSGIFTNAQGELEFFVGEHLNVGYGVLSVYRGGASSTTQTSSFAGYFSASAFSNQQQYTRPFALSTLAQVDDTNPAFVINKDVTDLTSENLVIDYGGNIHMDGRLIFRSDIASEISASGRLNITTTGDQIALQADGGNVVRILAKGNTEMFGAKSGSQTLEPGPTLRNISTSFLYAKDGVANVFVTSSLRAATALNTETLDYRGDAIVGVGSYSSGPNTSPKGAIVALTGSQWGVASSGSGACASSSLAIALTGGDQGTGEYLLNGIVNLPYAPGDRVGQLLYLGDNGSASAVPPSNPAHFSIPVGYYLGANTMYFSPDRTTGGANTVSATITNPGGSDTQVQFNDGGIFGGSSAFTFNKTSNALTLTGNLTASNNISASGDIIGLSASFANLSVSNLAAIGDSQTDTINITGNSLFMLEENNNGTFKIRENATQVDILAIQADDTPRAIFAFDPTHYDNDVDGQGRIGLGVATASIASKLHINLLTGSNAPTSIVRFDATGNDNIMFVSSSGNVGIGTGAPSELLTVAGNVSASGLLFVSASENSGQSYRVLVQDLATGRVYYTGSYADLSPYTSGSGIGDIRPKLGSNLSSGSFNTVGGGQGNQAFGSNSFIAGGSGSIIESGNANAIIGGRNNSISGSNDNLIAGNGNVIDAGSQNVALGSGNTLTYVLNNQSFVHGLSNSSMAPGSFVTGRGNTISTETNLYRIGGRDNTISGTENSSQNPGGIFAGANNTLGPAIARGQIIVGGNNNTLNGRVGNSVILTGNGNIIDDSVQPTSQTNESYLSILNGNSNQITGSAPTTDAAKDQCGKFSTIINGESNRIQTGGATTQTLYKYNTIVNGTNNLISGSGITSDVSGLYNTIVNGANNIIMPDVSGSTIVAGHNIKADRSDTVYAANLSLTNLPTSAAGLPVGAVYRTGSAFDELKIVV